MKKYITIDEEGYFISSDGLRIKDSAYGLSLLNTLTSNSQGGFKVVQNNDDINVDSFDQPLVLQNIDTENTLNKIATGVFNYGFEKKFDLSHLSVDEWDRFHGLTLENIPFVFSRKAQAELFNSCDSFTDDSFTFQGHEYPTKNLYQTDDQVNENSFWNKKYIETNFKPGWDLNTHHPALVSITAQLKLVKSRILVLGCGAGHNCAFFAKQGHVVTGIDFSHPAIEQAKKNYPDLPINWIQSDIFKLPESLDASFDVVFDHTLYCAIAPTKRKNLIKIWKRLLIDRGHLLGIFFSMFKPMGPPYGGSEWELRERMQKDFDFRYWSRWRFSPANRDDLEFIVYAQKK